MAAFLYLATAIVLLVLARRWVVSLSPPAAAALVLFPLFFAGRALLTGDVYAPIDLAYHTEPLNWMRSEVGLVDAHNDALNDVATQMIPYRKEVRDALRRGEWPLWDPSVLAGNILAAAAQPAPYSPFTVLACLLPVAQGFTFTAAIWFFLAALSMFLFIRELGGREVVALFAAAGWMYSTAVAFFILWPVGESWTLLPLVLLGARRVVHAPSLRSASLLTSAFTLLILAGHPETVVHVVAIGAAYGLFELLRRRREIARAIAASVGAGVVALALCAVDLLTILDAAPQTHEYESRRQHYTVASRATPVGAQLARFAADMLPAMHARAWRSPEVAGIPPDSATVGSIVLAAAVFALWRVRRAEKWFFGALLLFGLLARAGFPPISRALASLPLFDMTLNERFSYAAAFALVVLAALALEELARNGGRLAFAVVCTLVLVAITLAPLAILKAGLVKENYENYGDFRLFADVTFLGLAALLFVVRVPVRTALPLLVVLLLIQRTAEDSGVYPTLPADAAYPQVPLFAPMQETREPFRVAGHGLAFIPGMSAMYGLEDVRGYAAMRLASLVRTFPLWCIDQPVWFNRIDDLDRPFLSFLNVRYVITWTQEREHPGWREVARSRGTKLLENEKVLPRAFVPRTVRFTMDDEVALAEMTTQEDFGERAWIRTQLDTPEIANGTGRLTLSRIPYGFAIDAVMERAGWVVISEPAWRGWRVSIDGRPVPHRIANIAFLGVSVPAGPHRLRVVYWPESFVIGRAISGATLVALALFTAARAFLRRRKVAVFAATAREE